MTGGIVLGISLCFNDHAPEQAAVVLALHQVAADQFRGNDLCRSAEERERQSLEMLGKHLVDVRVAEQQNLLIGVTAGASPDD